MVLYVFRELNCCQLGNDGGTGERRTLQALQGINDDTTRKFIDVIGSKESKYTGSGIGITSE